MARSTRPEDGDGRKETKPELMEMKAGLWKIVSKGFHKHLVKMEVLTYRDILDNSANIIIICSPF